MNNQLVSKKQGRGGKREGAGRKRKVDEQVLAEKLSPLEDIAFEALAKSLQSGEAWAVKLFFEYKFGRPAMAIDLTSSDNSFSMPVYQWVEEVDENT